jgi:membrane protease YdiL (CAAX protease family)
VNHEQEESVIKRQSDKPEAVQKKKVGYGPLAAIFVGIGAFFAAQVIAGIVLLIYYYASGTTEENLQDNPVVLQFFTVLIVEAATIWLLWLFMRGRKVRWPDIGLVKPRFRDAGYAVVGYIIYFALLIAATQLASKYIPGFDLEQEQELGFDKATTGGSLWLIFISLVILPPIVEEIVARGFLYTGLRTKLPVISAALITSALFGLAHLAGGEGGTMIWAAVLDTFVLSLILCGLREKTGSLWAPISVHMFKNALAFAVLFVFKVP